MQGVKRITIICLLVWPMFFSATPINTQDSAVIVARQANVITKEMIDSVRRNTRAEWYKNQNIMIDGLTGVIRELNQTVIKMGMEQQHLLRKIDSAATSNDLSYRASFMELKKMKEENSRLEAQNRWYKYQPLILFAILFIVFANFVISGGLTGFRRGWRKYKQQLNTNR